MGQFRQRIGLVHELGELRAAEEFPDRRHHRPDIDQRCRCSRSRVHLCCHPLFDDPLHSQQSYAYLVLYQLADGPDSAVAQMVDVVRPENAVVDLDHHLEQGDDVLGPQGALVGTFLRVESPVELVATYLAQVVAPGIEEQVLYEILGVLDVGRLTGSQPAIELQQRLFLIGNARVLLDSRLDVLVLRVLVNVLEEALELLISGIPQRAQKGADRRLPLPVDLD